MEKGSENKNCRILFYKEELSISNYVVFDEKDELYKYKDYFINDSLRHVSDIVEEGYPIPGLKMYFNKDCAIPRTTCRSDLKSSKLAKNADIYVFPQDMRIRCIKAYKFTCIGSDSLFDEEHRYFQCIVVGVENTIQALNCIIKYFYHQVDARFVKECYLAYNPDWKGNSEFACNYSEEFLEALNDETKIVISENTLFRLTRDQNTGIKDINEMYSLLSSEDSEIVATAITSLSYMNWIKFQATTKRVLLQTYENWRQNKATYNTSVSYMLKSLQLNLPSKLETCLGKIKDEELIAFEEIIANDFKLYVQNQMEKYLDKTLTYDFECRIRLDRKS